MFSKIIDRLVPEFPIKVTSKWPAIILADSRIAKVPGRMMFLIVSIMTRNGKRIDGAPCGTRWASIWVVLFIQPKIINVSQRGSLKDKVKLMCLVLVKI